MSIHTALAAEYHVEQLRLAICAELEAEYHEILSQNPADGLARLTLATLDRIHSRHVVYVLTILQLLDLDIDRRPATPLTRASLSRVLRAMHALAPAA